MLGYPMLIRFFDRLGLVPPTGGMTSPAPEFSWNDPVSEFIGRVCWVPPIQGRDDFSNSRVRVEPIKVVELLLVMLNVKWEIWGSTSPNFLVRVIFQFAFASIGYFCFQIFLLKCVVSVTKNEIYDPRGANLI